jgi:hypothetical protein
MSYPALFISIIAVSQYTVIFQLTIYKPLIACVGLSQRSFQAIRTITTFSTLSSHLGRAFDFIKTSASEVISDICCFDTMFIRKKRKK